MRKIIHIDMDAFFFFVLQREDPFLSNKPLIVAGLPEHRGVVCTASYEARRYGIHSAMATHRALKLCPQVILLEPNMELYKQVSGQIRRIFERYTPLIEPLSIDEAFLEVTTNLINERSATRIAEAIRNDIRRELHLTASAGVSYNKFLAKIASDLHKPDGLTVITPEMAEEFLENLPIEKFYGIGRSTSKKCHLLGIRNGRDLKRLTLPEMIDKFGKSGVFYYNIVRGVDNRTLEINYQRKSFGREITFSQDISGLNNIRRAVCCIAQRVLELMQKRDISGRTVSIKVRYDNFETVTRSITIGNYTNSPEIISEQALKLLLKTEVKFRKVRLLGVSMSNLPDLNGNNAVQLEFNFGN